MRALLLAGVMALGWTGAAKADLITNGNFSSTYTTGSESASTPSQLNYGGYGVTGWTSSPSEAYTFLFSPSLAGSAGYSSVGEYGSIQLYTSANGGSATAPAMLASPAGGNFIAASGAYQPGPLSQVINGLSPGSDYILTFYWAAVQQAGFSGVTTESWGVTFGNQSFTTATVTTPDKGFTPWQKVTYEFRASAATQTISFLASGGPSGAQRPFSLLDEVSLVPASPTAVPEPASLALLALPMGLAGLVVIRRRRDTGAV